MDALDWLEQQHRDLNELFAQVGAAETAGRRTALVAQLVRAVEAHSRVEETVFYAAFSARIGGDEARLWDAFENHALLRFTALNLLCTRATDVRFAARLKAVGDLLRKHAHAEEDWMFPRAKRVLHDEALDRIGGELSRAHASRFAVAKVSASQTLSRRRTPERDGGARRRPAVSSLL